MPLKLCALSSSLFLQSLLGCTRFETSIDLPPSVGPYLLIVSNRDEAYHRGTPSPCLLQRQHLANGLRESPHLLRSTMSLSMTGCCSTIVIVSFKRFLILRKTGIGNIVSIPLPKTHAFGTNPIHQHVVWLDGTTVKREEGNLIYLGVPLPFLNVKREAFYAPIIDRLCAALNKVARARIPFHQAATVVATKVAPSLAYAAMIVRPTCKQLCVLRNHIYIKLVLTDTSRHMTHKPFFFIGLTSTTRRLP